jgi:hypothetical protein
MMTTTNQVEQGQHQDDLCDQVVSEIHLMIHENGL